MEGYDALPERPDPSPGRPITLGFFARLCPEKGLDTLVDAFIALRKGGRNPALRLKIAGGCGPGDEPFVNRMRQRLEAAGLGSQFSLHRNVSRAEKVAFYASCDVVSVPARTEEAFGLYVIESLAAGTPLVQPASGAFPELLEATGGGVTCGANTAEALAATLDPLLQNSRQLRELGRAGRAAVFREFTDDGMARRTLVALENILGGQSGETRRNRTDPIASSAAGVQTNP
jgi:glycosyltransferase involved in cell wall biosynthesis